MEDRKQDHGWNTFLEHWGFLLLISITSVLVAYGLNFFTNLGGGTWIYFAIASFFLLFLGAALIFYAKIPVYRSSRFFTFGIKSVPKHLAVFYRGGWCVFLMGVVLSLCLLLSRP